MRLTKRKIQIDKRLVEIDEEMDDLLQQARKKAAEIRGKRQIPVEIGVQSAPGGHVVGKPEQRDRSRLVLGY